MIISNKVKPGDLNVNIEVSHDRYEEYAHMFVMGYTELSSRLVNQRAPINIRIVFDPDMHETEESGSCVEEHTEDNC